MLIEHQEELNISDAAAKQTLLQVGDTTAVNALINMNPDGGMKSRSILNGNGSWIDVIEDDSGENQLTSTTTKQRSGRQIKK